jgi:hypothetical protein
LKNKEIFILCSFIVSFLSLTGCVSLVEKGGKVLDGSASGEKINARYRHEGYIGGIKGFEIQEVKNKAGAASVIIMLDQFPAVKLRGAAPDARGNFQLSSLEYLEGTLSGWNEFTLELSAECSFTHEPGEPGILSLGSLLEPIQISAGKIRRSGSRIVGEEALTSLRNRYNRIQALAEWMKQQEGIPAAFTNQKSFEAYWKPILFPELVSRKERPSAISSPGAAIHSPRAVWQEEGAQWVRAEEIKWNVTYTEKLLNEELQPLRNSGALLRDWEEAPLWIYLEYAWSSIEGALQNGINMQQIIKK